VQISVDVFAIRVLHAQLRGVGFASIISLVVGACVGLAMVAYLPPDLAEGRISLKPTFFSTKVQVRYKS
jgi:hypothetical protein